MKGAAKQIAGKSSPLTQLSFQLCLLDKNYPLRHFLYDSLVIIFFFSPPLPCCLYLGAGGAEIEMGELM